MPAAIVAPQRLGRVFHQFQTIVRRHRAELFQVGRVPEGVHRHEGADDTAGGPVDALFADHLGNRLQVEAQSACVHAEARRLDFHEVGPRTAITHRVGRRDKRERGHQHLVIGPHARQKQGHMQGGGSVDHRDRVPGSGENLHLPLETINERPDRGNKGRVDALEQILALPTA